MKSKLVQELITDWRKWIASFDTFVKGMPRDQEEKMWQARSARDYCIWKTEDSNLYTISYQYVHMLTPSGEMHCLQELTDQKIVALDNYKKLYSHTRSNLLPVLVDNSTIDVNGITYCYTKFASPNNELGTPPAYNLLNIMKNSHTVVEDFGKYLRELVDSHCWLISESCKLNLPLYQNNHALINHFVDSKNLYFKDTMFDHVTTDYEVTEDYLERITEVWTGAFDGFWRSQGIISVYRSRPDYSEDTINSIYAEILKLITYAETQCRKLTN